MIDDDYLSVPRPHLLWLLKQREGMATHVLLLLLTKPYASRDLKGSKSVIEHFEMNLASTSDPDRL